MNFINIKVKSKTWLRDSYGLFDYETKEIIRNQIVIEKRGFLVRDGNEIKFVAEENNEDVKAANKLLIFSEENGSCFIQEMDQMELWMTLSSKVDKAKMSNILREGDELKMGRILFKVLQIKINKEEKYEPNYKSFMSSLMENFDICQKSKQSTEPALELESQYEKKICRICLGDSHDDENPLLDPCHCSGTMNYVHYYCLQTWLIKRLNLEKSKGVISIVWQSLICELCHTVFPLTMNYKDKTYDLINFFENPEYGNNDMSNHNNSTFCNKTRNTMLLKSFTKEGLPNGLHLIEFSNTNNNEITIGRGTDCQIRVNDISVSRQHAKICFDNLHVTLHDNSSKFGTLVKVNKKDLLTDDKNLYLQVGRTSFEIQISKKWNLFGICFNCSERTNTNTYLKEKKV